MATFLFVPGAWYAGWCWASIVAGLEQAGHCALAPDLLGTGDDPTPLATVAFPDWVDQLAGLIEGAREPVILVGHSRGGILLTAVAERLPDRIARLVYVSALLLRDGESPASYLAALSERLEGVVALRDDGTLAIASDAAVTVLFNATDPAVARHAIARLGPEPGWTMSQSIRSSDARYGSVPRAYIECAQDRAIPLATQRAMTTALPCDPVATIDADHSPFSSAPGALTEELLKLVQLPRHP